MASEAPYQVSHTPAGVEVHVERALDPFETVGLIGKISDALHEAWPPLEPGWEKDKLRTVVGKSRDRKR